MTKTVFVPTSGSISDWKPVKEMFEKRGWEVETDHNEAGKLNEFGRLNLVCFTGGSDVSPHLYGEENISSYNDPIRDEYEQDLYEEFTSIPKVGICRGGQFLNVMNGGKLIQHLGKTISGDVVISGPNYTGPVRVDHHQGIIRSENNFAKGKYRLIDLREDNSIRNENSPEYVLYYPKTRSLCFQPHPEWGHKETEDLFFDLIEEYLI